MAETRWRSMETPPLPLHGNHDAGLSSLKDAPAQLRRCGDELRGHLMTVMRRGWCSRMAIDRTDEVTAHCDAITWRQRPPLTLHGDHDAGIPSL
jgi:hypothetical protein